MSKFWITETTGEWTVKISDVLKAGMDNETILSQERRNTLQNCSQDN